MLIMKEDSFRRFNSAVDDLTDGTLLLCEKRHKLYFSASHIYSNFAGYSMCWKEFIGFQNAVFCRNIESLKMLSFDLFYREEEDEQPQQLVKIENRDICKLIYSIVGDSEQLSGRLELYSCISEMKHKEKKEMYRRMVKLYPKLFMFKAWNHPVYISGKDQSELIRINENNLRKVWKRNTEK